LTPLLTCPSEMDIDSLPRFSTEDELIRVSLF
jgi:hypothetical protein